MKSHSDSDHSSNDPGIHAIKEVSILFSKHLVEKFAANIPASNCAIGFAFSYFLVPTGNVCS